MSDSVECQTFRTCFKNVVGGISDPNSLAVSLYSKGIISDVTRAEVASTGVILTDRILKLLVAVEYQIRRDSKVFHSFLGALREDKSLVYLADFLTAAYRICKWKCLLYRVSCRILRLRGDTFLGYSKHMYAKQTLCKSCPFRGVWGACPPRNSVKK